MTNDTQHDFLDGMTENQVLDLAQSHPGHPADASEAGLSDVAKEAAQIKLEVDELESRLTAKKEALKKATGTILKTLELLEIDSIRANGFLFYKKTKTSVQTPKTTEDKKLLFDYLESKGVFLEMVSVHSATLNTLYKDQAAVAAEAGNFDFKLPGVAEPTTFTTLELRKAK